MARFPDFPQLPARALALLLTAAAHLVLAPLGFAQRAAPPAAATSAPLPATTAARIRQVENSLRPYVPVAGVPGWNLLDRMKFHRVPGLSIAVIHNYRVEWAKAYGLADTVARTPVTTETLFSAGSISKLVTAGAALALVQEGKLTLDAPINDALRSWKLADNDFTRAAPVTLRRLLSHQGGTSQSSYWGFVPGQYTGALPSVVDILSGQPAAKSRAVGVNKQPGTGFQYSGGGYLVAQMALMDVSGLPFTDLTEKTLFRPLQMPGATFAQPLPPALARRAAGAYSENAWFEGRPYVYPQQAPAGLYATPTDLARFLIEIQEAYRGQGKVLTQASARAMLTPEADVSTGTYREQMGVGAFLLQRADRPATDDASRYFEHTGVNAGFLAYALASVTGGNGVVVMLNNDGGASELGKEIRRAVAQVYDWTAFLPPPIQPTPRLAATLDAYAGRYRRGPDEVMTFRREGDHLVQVINAGAPIPCYPVGVAGAQGMNDTIAFTDYTTRGTFRRDAATGAVTGFLFPGADQPMPRLRPDEFVPSELLRLGRLTEAMAGYRALNLNEYQLTYLVYDLLNPNRRPRLTPSDLAAAEALLTLGQERFPQSGIVPARWGDLYTLRGQPTQARTAYETALRLNPDDDGLKQKLRRLTP